MELNLPAAADAEKGAGRAGLPLCPDVARAAIAAVGCCQPLRRYCRALAGTGLLLPPSRGEGGGQAAVSLKVSQQLDSHNWRASAVLCAWDCCSKDLCFCRRMAAKKKEVVLQVNISSQELWEEMLCLKGLIVVDAFQAWCGPCKTVVDLFRKVRNEVGSDLLHFAVAEVDSIDALKKYRGKCKPVFLFYAGGELVAIVRGANAPLLQKTILEQLAVERKALEHGRECVVVQDRAFSREEGYIAALQEEQQEGQIG
ncbi:thioredoxin domain-containing protein 6 isoform X2 [Aquila chrysaetos chrysaetos]|uniref:thioredoxin domain-containing protein 6 isoform X2 n=1 Tax=Aquila chrysaetos chrysaetos TaxID=223781 RepID=UPI001B7D2F8F|nr:thioredoxin domain-containing protein 6 isoform X2 [Aquila chrysaetos chrysaetos]